jgi:hypothetical protein
MKMRVAGFRVCFLVLFDEVRELVFFPGFFEVHVKLFRFRPRNRKCNVEGVCYFVCSNQRELKCGFIFWAGTK